MRNHTFLFSTSAIFFCNFVSAFSWTIDFLAGSPLTVDLQSNVDLHFSCAEIIHHRRSSQNRPPQFLSTDLDHPIFHFTLAFGNVIFHTYLFYGSYYRPLIYVSRVIGVVQITSMLWNVIFHYLLFGSSPCRRPYHQSTI